jgi:hypothetical protein
VRQLRQLFGLSPTTGTRLAAVALVAASLVFPGWGGHIGRSPSNSAEIGSVAVEPPLHAAGPPVVVASGIPYPEGLAFDASGGLWVSSAIIGQTPSAGVWYVPPGGHPVHVGGLAGSSALAWVGHRLYVVGLIKPGDGQVSVLEDFTGHSFAHRHVLLNGLAAGSHPLGIVLGPDGRLFVGMGALEDHSGPPGRIISVSLSGGAPVLQATGLRTAYGLAFWRSVLLVTVNGPDLAGVSPDVLQAFDPAHGVANFGFPECYNQGGSACARYPKPLAVFPSHATPEGVVVKGDIAYVADNGSYVAGYSTPSAIESVDLRTGRVNLFWRSPVAHDMDGLVLGPDGDLYATELLSGKVVRFDLH